MNRPERPPAPEPDPGLVQELPAIEPIVVQARQGALVFGDKALVRLMRDVREQALH